MAVANGLQSKLYKCSHTSLYCISRSGRIAGVGGFCMFPSPNESPHGSSMGGSEVFDLMSLNFYSKWRTQARSFTGPGPIPHDQDWGWSLMFRIPGKSRVDFIIWFVVHSTFGNAPFLSNCIRTAMLKVHRISSLKLYSIDYRIFYSRTECELLFLQ